jgi:hypothetical protein
MSMSEKYLPYDATVDPVNILLFNKENNAVVKACGDICYGYIHCQVVKPSPSESSCSTFLAQLNVNLTSIVDNNNDNQYNRILNVYSVKNTNIISMTVAPAHLVLGLNNHHVISYYWARAAGSGAAMEAPGVVVVYDPTTKSTAQLHWASEEGYTACNSNDGKRSEWAQYLRENDHVQLRPHDFEGTVRSEAFHDHIYGITMSGRPLGSEPIVACQWKIVSPRQ